MRDGRIRHAKTKYLKSKFGVTMYGYRKISNLRENNWFDRFIYKLEGMKPID